MPFKFADEPNASEGNQPEEEAPRSAPNTPQDLDGAEGPLEAAAASQSRAEPSGPLGQAQSDPSRLVHDEALRRVQDAALWSEPRVPSQRIFREMFTAGAKTEQELERLLSAHSTTMGWADYWAREGFLTEVVSGLEKHITLSRRAVLELELA